MKRTALQICAIAGAMGLAACGSHGTPPVQLPQSATPHTVQPMDVIGGPATRLLNVLLGDAAPNLSGKTLQRLDLGIKEIDAIENGQTTVLASYSNPRVVNVLAHQDDSGEQIANANVARSDYEQVRLVVDVASSSVKFTDGPRRPIDFLVNVGTSSSIGAGSTTLTTSDGPNAVDILVTQPFSIPQDHSQSVRVDFNAFESMAVDAADDVVARPTLFVSPTDDMGSIKGHVLNAAGAPVTNATVAAIAADGSIGNTDWTDDRGHFKLGTLRSGTYKLVIYNSYTTAAGRVLTASGESSANASVRSITGPTVTVTGGQATSAGTIAD
jgi:hypothetical protein